MDKKLIIKNARAYHGMDSLFAIPSSRECILDAENRLTALPALIDPHVHFRTPGEEYKENWISGATAAIQGGVCAVIDMPNNSPACNTYERLQEKKKLIEQQLREAKIPLHYYLYFGADKNHLDEIEKVKDDVIGIKVYMGSSTGDLLVNDAQTLEEIFRIAAKTNLIVSVHAENEKMLQKNLKAFSGAEDPAMHSKIRNREAAISATSQAIELAAKYKTRLFVLHLSTKEELELVRQAKKSGVAVFAEVTPHHLFLSENDYPKWGTKVQMNPPMRNITDQDALWEGIHDGTVDTIGTDHAPHTIEEKNRPYGKAPSGIPGIETSLPLLLNAYNENRLSLEKIVDLTHRNPIKIFGLEETRDLVLVDLERTQEVLEEELKTKCGWSPYAGQMLKGWPIFTILQGHVYQVNGYGEYTPPMVAEKAGHLRH